jgi:hypothetical protein
VRPLVAEVKNGDSGSTSSGSDVTNHPAPTVPARKTPAEINKAMRSRRHAYRGASNTMNTSSVNDVEIRGDYDSQCNFQGAGVGRRTTRAPVWCSAKSDGRYCRAMIEKCA